MQNSGEGLQAARRRYSCAIKAGIRGLKLKSQQFEGGALVLDAIGLMRNIYPFE